MSLRARLLAGMALVAIVLAIAAFAVTTTTERHLVDQVDAQRLSAAYVGVVGNDGSVQSVLTPNLSETIPPLPDIDAQTALDKAGTNKPFTVGSVDSSLRYR